MGKLRKTIHREVEELLDSTVFTASDFEVSFGESEDDEFLIHISLKYKPELTFSVSQHGPQHYKCGQIPGQLYEEDSYIVSNIQTVLDKIPLWALEARNELKADSPLFRDVDELKRAIEQHINGNNSSDEFSVEEINDLKQKFEKLLQRVEILEKDKIITQKQFDEFKSGVEQVSEDLEYYPKDTWTKTASNKIYKTIVSIGKSKEGRGLIANGAKKLFGLE